jgi:hypothetical protein
LEVDLLEMVAAMVVVVKLDKVAPAIRVAAVAPADIQEVEDKVAADAGAALLARAAAEAAGVPGDRPAFPEAGAVLDYLVKEQVEAEAAVVELATVIAAPAVLEAAVVELVYKWEVYTVEEQEAGTYQQHPSAVLVPFVSYGVQQELSQTLIQEHYNGRVIQLQRCISTTFTEGYG